MKWFRLHSEFATDPKLKTFTKMQRYDLICLLCLANENKERGVINLDPEDIAATIDQDETEYAAFIAKLSKKGILAQREDGAIVFTNWLTRQYDKLSDTPKEAAARQQKRREGVAEGVTNSPEAVTRDPDNANVTPESRDVTRCHATYSDTDSENTQNTPSECEAGAPVSVKSAPKPVRIRPRHNPEAFSEVWAAYPKHENQTDAIAAWDSVKLNPDTIDLALAFIAKAKQTDRWRKNYVKRLDYFIRKRLWTDDLSSYADGLFSPGTRSLAAGSNKPGGMTIEDRKNETLAALRAG